MFHKLVTATAVSVLDGTLSHVIYKHYRILKVCVDPNIGKPVGYQRKVSGLCGKTGEGPNPRSRSWWHRQVQPPDLPLTSASFPIAVREAGAGTRPPQGLL